MDICIFKGLKHIEDAHKVRTLVFIKEQKVSKEVEMDGLDKDSYHVIVYENNLPIATGRLLKKDNIYSIGRVAVIKDYRHKNYGKIVMDELIKKAKDLGVKEVFIHSQLHAKKFYEKLGFKPFGKVYKEANIKHISMKKKIK
ncbi:MAG: GNAT family N-acetyltransferase [Firmicutes bacterium]|nr:GNAT family N-acetyltransferase [Bacillota bacterium]